MSAPKRAALHDLYDRLEREILATAFDYPTIWRILNELDKTESHGPV